VIGALVVLSLASIFVFTAQAGSSFFSYLLTIAILVTVPRWAPGAANGLPVLALSVALLVYLPASAWWSQDFDPRRTFSHIAASALTLIFVLGVVHAVQQLPRFETWLARAMVVCGAVAAGAAIGMFLLEPPLDERLLGLGQISNSVVAAQVYGVALLFGLRTWLIDTGNWRWVAGIGVAVLLAAIILTDSRSMQFAIVVGACAYLLATRHWHVRDYVTRLGVSIVALLVVGATVLLIYPQLLELAFPRGDSYRLAIWQVHADRILTNGLWFGHGIHVDRTTMLDGRVIHHPHNIFLSVAVQGGLVGLALLLALIGVSAFALLRSLGQPMARLGFAILVTGAIAFLFDGWHLIDKVGRVWLFIWLPAAIATAHWHSPGYFSGPRMPRQRS
jgi:O-antigen ligase